MTRLHVYLPFGGVTGSQRRKRIFENMPVLALTGLVIAGSFLAGSAKVSQTAATIEDAENGIDTPAYLKKYAVDRDTEVANFAYAL